MSKDLGDFQTPLSLVNEVILCLASTGREWTRVLEPTCGRGNFIKGLLNAKLPLREIQGIEIQSEYVKQSQVITVKGDLPQIAIRHSDIFDVNLQTDLQWEEKGPLLVVGNPPWVTNAQLGTLRSTNVPVKTNFKGLSGFDAMTGNSNFDIAEYIFLKLIRELAVESPTIALLCKTSVARNILKYGADIHLPISRAFIRKIDSKKNFGAFVDACLFYVEVGFEPSYYQAEVYQDLHSPTPISITGVVNGQLVSNIDLNKDFTAIDGKCTLTWRQGVKHDAASVVELTYDDTGKLHNKLGEIVNVEQDYIYPLLKSTDLGGTEKKRPRKAVVVTQKRISEDTIRLEENAPHLWKYLLSHKDVFERRKSSIYNGKAAFSMFGIGDYSFSPYKVAISGLHKSLKFAAIGPVAGQPVMLDDTCYFLACQSAQQAALIAALLNDPVCISFVHSIIFWDAKRPVTKKLLQRINLLALLSRVDQDALILRANVELVRLISPKGGDAVHWPENLADLLQDTTSNMKSVQRNRLLSSDQTSLSKPEGRDGEIFQLSFY